MFSTSQEVVVKLNQYRFQIIPLALLLLVASASFSQVKPMGDSLLEYLAVESFSAATDNEVAAGLPQKISKSKLLSGLEISPDSEPWLGSFSFGDVDSRTVAVALVHQPDGNHSLFVDTDRDHQLADESPKTTGRDSSCWLVDLKPEYSSRTGSPAVVPVQIRFRWDSNNKRMFKRVVGAMSGTIDFQNEQRRVYLGDLNNNGRWLDSSDRIFLDVNGDGRISRITERLESTGIINIRGELYSCLLYTSDAADE